MPVSEVGTCRCPICGQQGALVKKGDKGKHYINCDSCCSLLRTMSREGDECIKKMMVAAAPAAPDSAPAAAAASEKKPAADDAPAKKKRGAAAAALATLTGGDDE